MVFFVYLAFLPFYPWLLVLFLTLQSPPMLSVINLVVFPPSFLSYIWHSLPQNLSFYSMEKAVRSQHSTLSLWILNSISSHHTKGIFSPPRVLRDQTTNTKIKASQYTSPQVSQSQPENTVWDIFSIYSVWLAFIAVGMRGRKLPYQAFVEELADSPACWTTAELCLISLVTTANKHAQKGGDTLLTWESCSVYIYIIDTF